MATEFQMPKLGLTMEEATIVEWFVADGDEVHPGAPVLSIETDKVATDVEASGSGLVHLTGVVGETYACGARIGWFLEPGETPPADEVPNRGPTTDATASAPAARPATARPVTSTASHPRGRDGARLFASPNARRVAAGRGVDLRGLIGTGPGGRIVSEDVPATAGTAARVPATTAAMQVATRLGVDLAEVRPAGPSANVTRADVERHVRELLAGTGAAPSTVAAPEAPLVQTPSSTIPFTGMRGTIASRMHSSLRDMAQLTLTMDVVMDTVIDHRNQADPSARPGYTDYVLAAVAGALVDHPVVNSQIVDGHLALLPEINLGLAVALDGGLVVPVVRRADTLSIEELSRETSRLAAAARSGKLALADLEGGTFSVTALGMFGVDAFTPVINPPNTAILGVGRLRDGVQWVGDVATRTTLLTVSLTWDHRGFDGAPAAEFTAAVRDRLEGWGPGEQC